MRIAYFFSTLILFTLCACGGNTVYTPKPHMYPHVNYPEKKYQAYEADCPFRFEYPTYAVVMRDSTFFDKAAPSDCWFNLQIPSLNATLFCSYYKISGKNTFDKLRNDAFTMAGKHNLKADYIDELIINKPNGVRGYVFDIQGAVASPFQFYLSDSTSHFLRGALYINAQAKPDSLAPVFDFLKKDVIQMINTFEWK